MKCSKLIFSIKTFTENYANVILIGIMVLFFICLFYFLCKGYYDGIKYYINAIIYFSLFPIRIAYIIKKKKEEEKTKNRNDSNARKNKKLNSQKTNKGKGASAKKSLESSSKVTGNEPENIFPRIRVID